MLDRHIEILEEWAQYPIDEYKLEDGYEEDKEIVLEISCPKCGSKDMKYYAYFWRNRKQLGKPIESYIGIADCPDCEIAIAF